MSFVFMRIGNLDRRRDLAWTGWDGVCNVMSTTKPYVQLEDIDPICHQLLSRAELRASEVLICGSAPSLTVINSLTECQQQKMHSSHRRANNPSSNVCQTVRNANLGTQAHPIIRSVSHARPKRPSRFAPATIRHTVPKQILETNILVLRNQPPR